VSRRRVRNLGLGKEWMPERLWKQVLACISIPCVDVILENSRREVLLGWRKIPPYRNVWALPGGRVLKGESLRASAQRILAQYRLSAGELFLVGVFPVKFPTRADFTCCLASKQPRGVAEPDGSEFSSFIWTRKIPTKIGANYRKMILGWRRMRSPEGLTSLCSTLNKKRFHR